VITDAELDAYQRARAADADLDEDTADRYGEIADRIADDETS
jgi:hypothetical protein